MDAQQVLKTQAKAAIDIGDYYTAGALITALSAITGAPTLAPVVDPGPAQVPDNEKPQANNYDLERVAKLDQKADNI